MQGGNSLVSNTKSVCLWPSPAPVWSGRGGKQPHGKGTTQRSPWSPADPAQGTSPTCTTCAQPSHGVTLVPHTLSPACCGILPAQYLLGEDAHVCMWCICRGNLLSSDMNKTGPEAGCAAWSPQHTKQVPSPQALGSSDTHV